MVGYEHDNGTIVCYLVCSLIYYLTGFKRLVVPYECMLYFFVNTKSGICNLIYTCR
jgi:hypothetical protein